MKLLMESWRKFLTEDRSIEKKLGEIFWSSSYGSKMAIGLAQDNGNNELAQKMIETVDQVKEMIALIDEAIEDAKENFGDGSSTFEKMTELEDARERGVHWDNPENPAHKWDEEEWWDKDKYDELWMGMGMIDHSWIADAIEYVWFAGGGKWTAKVLNEKTAKDGYEYIKDWAGVE